MLQKSNLLKSTAITLCLLLTTTSTFADNKKITSVGDKVSYGMGLKMGSYLKSKKFDGFDIELLFLGINDGIGDGTHKVSDEDQQIAFEEMKVLEEKKAKAAAEKNIKIGKDFLAQNGKRKGVITTKSGLQYEIITNGKGAKPQLTDTVKTHYRGTLIDGSEFDSSYARKRPATFALNRVIKGWTEGLQLINVGTKCKLSIPAELAYGSRPSAKIPANSTLIFEIELLEIVKKEESKKTEKKVKKVTPKKTTTNKKK